MYHRIFLGMAAHDIIRSLTFIAGTWAIPKSIDTGYFWNVGTETSCAVQAFLAELSMGVFMYLSALCIFSYLAVRHDFKEKIYKRFEKLAHFVCMVVPLVVSIAMVSSKFHGPDGKYLLDIVVEVGLTRRLFACETHFSLAISPTDRNPNSRFFQIFKYA